MPASTLIAAGHTESVLCCEVLQGRKLLASGGEDAIICLTDLTTFKPAGLVALQELGDAVPALCSHPSEDHTLFAAAGSSALQLDLRRGLDASAVCRCFDINAEEVNSVAVSAANGGWLAAGDDAGEVQVISLAPSGGSSSSPADGAGGVAAAAVLLRPERPASYKTLRRGHSNICAAVAFRPHRPWELLSGGLDSTVVRWDFNRLRPLQSWNLAGEATASGGQLFNPPMVHCVAVPQTEERGLCRLMAVGRGDGCVSLYDADWKPAASGSSSSSSGSGGGKKGRSKAGARQRGGAARQQAAAAAAGAAGVPGRLALLGPEQGGHTAAVNSVAFLPGSGSGWEQLLSAGNDCRLLLWNWGAAQAQAAADVAAAADAAANQEANEPSSSTGSGSSLRQGGEPAATQDAAATASDAAAESVRPLLAAEHRHGRKINCARPADVAGCGYSVFIADTGRRLTALALV